MVWDWVPETRLASLYGAEDVEAQGWVVQGKRSPKASGGSRRGPSPRAWKHVYSEVSGVTGAISLGFEMLQKPAGCMCVCF